MVFMSLNVVVHVDGFHGSLTYGKGKRHVLALIIKNPITRQFPESKNRYQDETRSGTQLDETLSLILSRKALR
jgi:hypothetical protein